MTLNILGEPTRDHNVMCDCGWEGTGDQLIDSRCPICNEDPEETLTWVFGD